MNGYTIQDIALIRDVSERAVRKRLSEIDCSAFMLGTTNTGGRSAQVYDPAVLTKLYADSSITTRNRQQRSDAGAVRKCKEEWERIKDLVRGLYLNNAQGNLKLACEQAVAMLRNQGITVEMDVYRRLQQKRLGPDGLPTGEFHREGWELLRKSRLRKADFAKQILPTSEYDMMPLLESIGVAGQGFGASRIWVIDGRKSDAWIKRGQRLDMPSALYIRCGLTGYPLHVEPMEHENAQTIIRAMIRAGFRFGFPDYAVVLDNGAAMMSTAVSGVIMSLFDAHRLADYATGNVRGFRELFGPQTKPIVTNLPNIPRYPLKAAIERSFKIMKDEFDATRRVLNYQGGNRSEAVQLTVRNMQLDMPETSTMDDYFADFTGWLYSDYIRRQRPDMLRSFSQMTNLAPTIENAFFYYYNKDKKHLPPSENLATMLYYASEYKRTVKAEFGYVDVQIDNKRYHYICAELDHRYYGQRIAVIPVPGSSNTALLMLDNDATPRYIGTAVNARIDNYEQLVTIRPAVTKVRNDLQRTIAEERNSKPLVTWENQHGTPNVPEVMNDVEEWFAPPSSTSATIDTQAMLDDDNATNEVSPEVAQLLGDINKLIGG